MAIRENKCIRCGVSGEVVQLERCPVCYSNFCAECVHRGSGRRLCSERCAQILIYGDEDEQDRNPEEI